MIHYIAGGPAGGDSRNARERTARDLQVFNVAYGPEIPPGTNVITFYESEVPQKTAGGGDTMPPDVPLVISLTVSGFTVNRVLIDGGSSANIISSDTLGRMRIPHSAIQECC